MQNKGVVMQVAEGYAVVMTKNCEFRKIPLIEGMALGQEVDVPSETIVVPKKARTWYQNSWMKTGMVAASLLLAVGLWTGQSLVSGSQAYAYVSVDINPSIELSIDQRKQVVSVIPLNSDGEKVLSEVQLIGLSVDQAVSKLADIARSHGYLHDKSEVIITASPAIEEAKLVKHNMNLDQLETQLVAQVKALATTYGTELDVEGIRVSDSVRTAAHDAGVSPGKYALYLAALSNGIDVDINELKTQPISKIVDQRGTQLAAVLHDLKGGEQLDGLLQQYKSDGMRGKSPTPAVLPSNNLPQRNDNPALPVQPQPQVTPPKVDDKSNNGNGNPAPNKGQPSGRENGNQGHDNANNNKNGNGNKGNGNNEHGNRDGNQGNGNSNGQGSSHKSDDKGSDHHGNWNWNLNVDLNLNLNGRGRSENDHSSNYRNNTHGDKQSDNQGNHDRN